MSSTPRGSGTKGAIAVALLLSGLVCAGLYRVLITTEHHSYAADSVPPKRAHVTAGNQYLLAVPGGVRSLENKGVDVTTPQCTYAVNGGAVRALTVQPEGTGTKATNALGTFFAPESGDIDVDCLGWGPLFIDNADDAKGDLASGLLVLAAIVLVAGVGLGLSALRSAGGDPDESGWAPRQDDEIERLVHLVHVRSRNDEVGRGDGDDVLP